MSIEGIPDGWELVRVGRPRPNVDWVVKYDGTPYMPNSDFQNKNYAIIRKIEKPKQYRPFANAAEFEPFRDRWVKRLDSLGSASRISGYGDKGVVIHGVIFTFNGLFRDHTFDDGTPFGIEVTE